MAGKGRAGGRIAALAVGIAVLASALATPPALPGAGAPPAEAKPQMAMKKKKKGKKREKARRGKRAGRPGDPLAKRQVSLDQIDGRDPLEHFRRPPVEIPIAVVDSGVALGHRDLRPRLWRNPAPVPGPVPRGRDATIHGPQGPVPAGAPGWDAIGTDRPPFVAPDPDPEDPIGHGTAVASIAAAATDNGIGMAGVAPNGIVIAMRSCWSGGNVCYDGLTGASMAWAAGSGARVVNLSLIADGAQIERSILANPRVLFVAAAGNSAADLDSGKDVRPCEIEAPNLICVAATDRSQGLASCSNYGARQVDVGAPGFGITVASTGGGYFGLGCGTSLAAPHVSGLAALLFGAVPEAGVQQVKAAILDAVAPSPGLSGRVARGGEIDVRRSLELLQDRFGIPHPPDTRIRRLRRLRRGAVRFRLRAEGTRSTGFECAVDEGDFRPCRRRLRLRRLKRGRHLLEARARGTSGAVDPTPARRAFRVVRPS